jgi:uncharacterized protein
MIVELLPFLVTGVAAGVIAGLLGVGGGIIIVPALAFLLAGGDVAAERLMHVAVGTSLACIVVTSISSLLAHHRRGAVDWAIFRRLGPGIAFGAVVGAFIAADLHSETLAAVFAIFLLIVAARMVLAGQPPAGRSLPRDPALSAWGVGIGTMSALVGIGGGTMTVPLLAWSNVPLHRAVGTSAACGLPIAVAGAAAFVYTGWGLAGLPPGSTGHIYWPAFLAVAPVAVATAPLGARLAHSLPVKPLRIAFAVFMVAVALRMLLS